MVIGVIGSTLNRNHRVEALCSIATASSISFKQKSLIISLCNRDGQEVLCEDLLVGKQLDTNNVLALSNTFSDTGIDALLSRVESERITQDTFDTCCLQTLKGIYTMDIATATSKTSLEEELVSKIQDVQNLFESAQNVYDILYVLLPHNNSKLTKKLYPLLDKIVVCVNQGLKEDILEPTKKTGHVLVTDYDNASQFSTKYLGKQYGYPTYALKHNALFKDACTTNNLLKFFLLNEKIDQSDDNYDLMHNLMKLAETLVGNVEPVKQKEYELTRLTPHIEQKPEMKKLEKEMAEQKTVKKGFLFFRKKRTIVTANTEAVHVEAGINNQNSDNAEEMKKETVEKEAVKKKPAAVKKAESKPATTDKKTVSGSKNEKKQSENDTEEIGVPEAQKITVKKAAPKKTVVKKDEKVEETKTSAPAKKATTKKAVEQSEEKTVEEPKATVKSSVKKAPVKTQAATKTASTATKTTKKAEIKTATKKTPAKTATKTATKTTKQTTKKAPAKTAAQVEK